MAKRKAKPAPAPKRGRGRPTAYREEMVDQAYRLALLMLTDEEIASYLQVDIATLYRWKVEHPDFREAITRGKELADTEVVSALRERALGYEWTEEQAVKVKRSQHEEEVEVVEVRRRVPPDTPAGIFWLTNRQRGKWRQKQDVEHSGTLSLEQLVAESQTKEESE